MVIIATGIVAVADEAGQGELEIEACLACIEIRSDIDKRTLEADVDVQ
jgi:hypothetical protein